MGGGDAGVGGIYGVDAHGLDLDGFFVERWREVDCGLGFGGGEAGIWRGDEMARCVEVTQVTIHPVDCCGFWIFSVPLR